MRGSRARRSLSASREEGWMERIVERPGALDVHRASVTACVRVWDEGELIEHVAEFQTTIQGLLALRDWLEALTVKRVAMEATGVYWRPVWAVLEDRFELMLVNARHVKQVPGRKTDVKDAQWLCQLLEAGLLRASLVPPKPIVHAAQPDALPQDADQRPPARGRAAAEDPRGTPGSSSAVSPATSWASPVGRCSTRSSRARLTPACWPSSRAGSCARRSPRCA